MPYTKKQVGFFQAIAHGMKPTRTDSSLTPDKARELLSHDSVGTKEDKPRSVAGGFLKGLGVVR